MHNDCEGCALSYVISRCIALSLIGCPCEHCLVKMICVEVCDDLTIHFKKARAYMEENIRKSNLK